MLGATQRSPVTDAENARQLNFSGIGIAIPQLCRNLSGSCWRRCLKITALCSVENNRS